MKSLHELTPIGRGRRLRPFAASLLTEYGIDHARLRQVTEASNIIYHVSSNQRGEFALRMTAPKSCHDSTDIRSEVAWLRALARETDLGIAEPIARLDGRYVTTVSPSEDGAPINSVLFRWVPGVMLDERLTPDNVAQMGSLMARLHEHAATFEPPDGFRIRRYSSVFPYADEAFAHVEPIVLFEPGPNAALSEEQRSLFEQALQLAESEIRALGFDSSEIRVIHNDLHMWNVKVAKNRLYALDFEDMMWGHPLQDVATTLYYFRWDDRFEVMRDAFRRGYMAVRPWPEQHEGQLEILMAGRMLLLANYVAASEDAEDKAFAPEYLARVEGRLREILEPMNRV
jgi:Ser/Thr protein kinase RdoA (MazF antagonist)